MNNLSKSIREKTISAIIKYGFVNDLKNLPYIDVKRLRGGKEIAVRSIIHTELKSLTEYPEDRQASLSWMQDIGLIKFLTNKEVSFVTNKSIKQQDIIEFSWYQESLYVFLWSIGIVENLSNPDKESDVVNYLHLLPPDVSLDDFFSKINLRSINEIYEKLDLYYALHWLTRRDKKLNYSVIIERRKALEWIANNTLIWSDIELNT